MNPKVSIIVPVYNVENYLEFCLDSLIKQTFHDIEIICVNDGSTDNSLHILEEYQKKDKRIKIFNQKNQGLSHSRNVALKVAKGEYVLYVDSDDWIDLNTVKLSYETAKKYDLDLVMFLLINYDESKDELYEDGYYNNIWFPSEYDDKTFSFEEIADYTFVLSCPAPSKLYKRDLLIKNDMKFPKGLYFEDNPFHCEALICSKRMRIIRKHFYYRRRRDNSITSDNDEKLFDTIKISNLVTDAFKKYGVYEKYISLLLNRKVSYLIYCYGIIMDKYKDNYLKLIYNDFQEVKKDSKSFEDYKKYLNYSNKMFFDFLSKERKSKETDFLVKKYKEYNNINSHFNPKSLKEINVASILDALSYNSYSSECNLILLEPDNWLEIFQKNDIDIFFCESAWFGIYQKNIKNNIAIDMSEGPWLYKVSNSNHDNQTIMDILDYCKKNNIPSIFWNKEDPVSFDLFIDLALKFDYIFTTDVNSIIKYKVRGHKNVYPLIFATQLKQFNPIEIGKRSKKMIFAGSWYGNNKERCEVTEKLFDKILANNYELKIYDRKSDTSGEQWRFPSKYEKYIYPKVRDKISKVHKESKFAVNINTVTNSQSMFSRRIFELLSSNTFIISNYSDGLYNYFGDNIYYFDRPSALDLDDMDKIQKICEENVYTVLKNHTYTERLKYILNIIDFPYKEEQIKLKIIYDLNDSKNLKNIIDDYNSLDYEYKEGLIIIESEADINRLSKKNLKDFTFKRLNEIEIKTKDNNYFIFRDMSRSIEKSFVNKALLHYKYLDEDTGIRQNENKFTIEKSSKYKNTLFTSKMMVKIIENIKNNKIKNYKVYNI